MNKVLFLGRLVASPDLSYTQNEMAICRFRIAVRRDKENSDFFEIKAFGKTAEAIAKYFDKGQQGVFDCRIQNNNYEKDGKMIYSNQIICNSFYFAGSNAKQNSDELPF